ncbi:MAG TPA: DUF1702 family protein [Thermoanaerobaculia bacterium]|nr:DUF1702 family protein [Thermoanaerobaculia bacterium]
MGRLARSLFGISAREVSFDVRGFHGEGAARHHLETVGGAFVAGYNHGLEARDLADLEARLGSVPRERLGFAYEGAAMAVALLDAVQPWRRAQLPAFLAGPSAPHVYLAYVGIGWAIARLPLGRERRLLALDPVLRWLAIDGWGFHEAFFHPQRAVYRQAVPSRFQGYARRAFDHGVGRSLWFVEGAGAERIAATIGRFAPERHSDLWSGVGLASAYAGGVPRTELERLRSLAGAHLPALAQGVVFANKARMVADNVTPETALACDVFCGLDPEAVLELNDELGESLPPDAEIPAYEVWRRRIQEAFTQPEGVERWTRVRALSAATR